MREEGTIVGIEGRLAHVRMQAGPQCGRCCACSALGGGERELEVETDRAIRVGSRVVVEIAQGNPWLSASLLFVLPLAGLIAVLIVGAETGMGTSSTLALGFGVLVALFAVAAVVDKRFVRPRQKPPAIVEVLGPDT